MSTVPKVSIILPFYQSSTTLRRAIDSIISQAYQEWELILVSNNADNESISIAKEYLLLDERVSLYQEPRQGVVYATQKGYLHVAGTLICRMDADDEMAPLKLAKQVTFLNEYQDFGLVSCLVAYVPHHENTDGFNAFVDWSNQLIDDQQIYLNRFVELPLINPTIMFRKEIIDQYGFYRKGSFPEDYELQLRLHDQQVKMGKLKEVLFKWYDSDQRLTRTDDIYHPTSFYAIKAVYVAKFVKELLGQSQPEVWIWGAGKKSRPRANMLEEHGLSIAGWLDVKEKPGVVHFSEITQPDRFILSYVANRGIREEVRKFLVGKGFCEGKDFLILA